MAQLSPAAQAVLDDAEDAYGLNYNVLAAGVPGDPGVNR